MQAWTGVIQRKVPYEYPSLWSRSLSVAALALAHALRGTESCQVEAGNLELGAKSKLGASLGVNQGAVIRPARRHFAIRNITPPQTAHHQFQTRISSSLCLRTGRRTQVLYVLCVKRFFAPTRNRIRHAGCHSPAPPAFASPLIIPSQLAHLRIRPRRRYARSLESLSSPWPPPSTKPYCS